MNNFQDKQTDKIENYTIDADGLYTNLNRLVGGYNTGELIVIGARPATGKSTLALNMAICSSFIDTTLFYSIEMSVAELQDRASKFLDPKTEVHNLLIEADSHINLHDIESGIKKYKPKFVFIDYLNIMSDDPLKTRTTKLKAMAKKYNCIIFILAQLNRKAQNSRPDLAMLKDSGNIEQDATQVYFLIDGLLIVAKNRKGRIGDIPILFNKNYCLILEDKAKIERWAKCSKLHQRALAVGGLAKKILQHKIRKIDEEYYFEYVYNTPDMPTFFAINVGGK